MIPATFAMQVAAGSGPPAQDPGWVAWIPGVIFLLLALVTWAILRRLSR